MKRTRILLGLAACLLLGSVAAAPLAGMALNWWVMGGGEEPRSGGPLAMNATIGQPVIGQSSAGPLTLSSGYWYGSTAGGAKGYLPLLVKWHS